MRTLSDQNNQDDQNDPEDQAESSPVADRKDISLDDEPSAEPHDIDEQLEQFGLKKDDHEIIKPLGENSENIEE